MTYCRTPSDCAGGNNRSISVGEIEEVKFKKVSRRSRANEFNDDSCGAARPTESEKVAGQQKSIDRIDKQRKAAPQTVCWLKTNGDKIYT